MIAVASIGLEVLKPLSSNITVTPRPFRYSRTFRQSAVFLANLDMDLVMIRSMRPSSQSLSILLKSSLLSALVPVTASSAYMSAYSHSGFEAISFV